MSHDFRRSAIVNEAPSKVIFEPRIDALHRSALTKAKAFRRCEFAMDRLPGSNHLPGTRVLAQRHFGAHGAIALHWIDDGPMTERQAVLANGVGIVRCIH